MAYIYFSSAKCRQAASKGKSEDVGNPHKISTNTDLGGLRSQIFPLNILNSLPSIGALSSYGSEGKLCWPPGSSSWARLLLHFAAHSILLSGLLRPAKFLQPYCYCHAVGRIPQH